MVLFYVCSFLGAFFLSVLLTPLVRRFAIKVRAVDKPNNRKVHQNPIPLLGGVAIYLAFSLSYILLVYWTDIVATNVGYAVLIGGAVILITGIIDDMTDLKPRYKVLGQLIAAGVAIYFGLVMQHISIPFFADPIELGWFGVPITLFWILALTNAVNLIDGLDGLSSGVSAIAGMALFVVSLSIGNDLIASMMMLFVGGILGFLVFNFHPAKIFMGDSGALFLGYGLAIISLLELKQATILTFIIPIFMLSVPISDTLYAIIRRKLDKKPISAPDKNHLHHRLLGLGYSHRNTVLIIYAISFLFASLSVVLLHVTTAIAFFIVGFYLLFFEWFAEKIGMMRYRPLIRFMGVVRGWFRLSR